MRGCASWFTAGLTSHPSMLVTQPWVSLSCEYFYWFYFVADIGCGRVRGIVWQFSLGRSRYPADGFLWIVMDIRRGFSLMILAWISLRIFCFYLTFSGFHLIISLCLSVKKKRKAKSSAGTKWFSFLGRTRHLKIKNFNITVFPHSLLAHADFFFSYALGLSLTFGSDCGTTS